MSSNVVRLLDGGMSNALEDRGHDLSGGLWTARLLRDAPQEIAAVHRAYFAAGAEVATTASYQASLPGFEALGMSRAEAAELIRTSVRIARDVAEEDAGRLVAASVGPFGAYLADGSEYRGRYGVPAGVLLDFHRPRLELLAGAGPDLIAVETIPDTDEAEVLVRLLDEIGVPAWFSYSAYGLTTRAGQPLADAFALAASARSVVAVGVNCCEPSDVLPAVRLASATGKPAICYPNSGEVWAAGSGDLAGHWSGGSAFDPRAVTEWVAAGARYVGGCCRVGPDAIAEMAGRLAA